MPLAKDVDIEELAVLTEGFVGADLNALCREAALLALRENMGVKEVTRRYFEEALSKVRPSVTPDVVQQYKDIESQYLRSAKSALVKASRPTYLG